MILGRIALGAGAVSSATIWAELLPILRENDLSTPAGRFQAVTMAMAHVAPLLGASTLLCIGAWRSKRPWIRRGVGGYFALLLVLCLTGLWRLLPDSGMVVSTVPMDRLSPFRIGIVRSLLNLAATTALLAALALPLIRSPHPGSSRSPA